MEDNLLFDAIERYRNGQMDEKEKLFFEELKKNNPEIDQVVAEHSFFLAELERMSEQKKLRHNLKEAENKLINEGLISGSNGKTKAKIIYLWNRYRRTIAVAAAIACIVSLSTATVISKYSENKKEAVITPLVDNKLNQFEYKLNEIEHKLKDATAVPARPKFKADFRATGFLIDGRGYLITNAHVVENAKNLIVENKKGDQFYAQQVYSNPATDLAVLKITDTSFQQVNAFRTLSQNPQLNLQNLYLHWAIRAKKWYMAKVI